MIVEVRVIPKSKQAGCLVRNNQLVIRVTQPASEGKATEAARRTLAKILSVPEISVILKTGSKSRNKLFIVPDSVRWPPMV